MNRLLTCFLLLCSTTPAQRKVDARNTYQRLICVVPMTGAGTAADPKRPMYVPAPRTDPAAPLPAIFAWSHQVSDDGRYALVEYVARDQKAFAAILADKSIKTFAKGKDKKDDIEKELKKYKKDFDLDRFGLAVP